MESNIQNRAIALAALFQSIDGVRQIADTGNVNEELYQTSIDSVLNESADTAIELYGSLADLKTGFASMMNQLGSRQINADGTQKDMEATRYALGLLHLENKLHKNQTAFSEVIEGIQETQKKLEFFDKDHENITASLANIYANTISEIGPKIMVKGEQSHLANPKNASRIRALLLAGIRAALLWRQAGGNRWKLLLERGKLQKQAETFLSQTR